MKISPFFLADSSAGSTRVPAGTRVVGPMRFSEQPFVGSDPLVCGSDSFSKISSGVVFPLAPAENEFFLDVSENVLYKYSAGNWSIALGVTRLAKTIASADAILQTSTIDDFKNLQQTGTTIFETSFTATNANFLTMSGDLFVTFTANTLGWISLFVDDLHVSTKIAVSNSYVPLNSVAVLDKTITNHTVCIQVSNLGAGSVKVNNVLVGPLIYDQSSSLFLEIQ